MKTGISCPQPKTQLRHTLNFRDFFAPPLRKNKPLRVKGGQPAGLHESFCRFPSGLVFVFFCMFFFLPFSVSLRCVRPCSFQCLCLDVSFFFFFLFVCLSVFLLLILPFFSIMLFADQPLDVEQKHNLKSGKQR